MTLEEIDQRMDHIIDALLNTTTKLDYVADLNSALGKKLDRLVDRIGRLTDLSAAAAQEKD
jgi:hypothetical protein